MWICNKCETYNEDHEQFCCICNAKKSEASAAAQQPQQQGQTSRREPEITPAERLSATVVKPPKPKPASTLVKGGRDDLMEAFGMSGASKGITNSLIALNIVLLLVNILGRIFLG